jgi:chemotaxis protein MotA
MLVLIGIFLVLGATVGGFMLAGGHPAVLLHISEFVVIFGISIGILIIASPNQVLKDTVSKIRFAFSAKKPDKDQYLDLLKLLYEIFMVGRRNGLIALEEHVMDPEKSAIFARYPVVTAHKERLEFLINGLRPVIDGKIKPDQLENLMTAELDAKGEEADHPVHILQMVGDSLPGIGIVAAVLGIINTMAAIADGPAVVGERVAAALTGTFLGIFGAYGFVNPIATRIKFNNAHDQQYLKCILSAVAGFAKGLAPVTAVEIARRSLDSGIQPSPEELETAVKGLTGAAK